MLCVHAEKQRARACRPSGQDVANDFAADVSEAKIAALEAIGQPRVVEPEQVQDGGLQVVGMNRLVDRRPAELVGRAIGEARLARRRRP